MLVKGGTGLHLTPVSDQVNLAYVNQQQKYILHMIPHDVCNPYVPILSYSHTEGYGIEYHWLNMQVL